MSTAPTLPLPCPTNSVACLTIIFMDAGQGDSTLIVYPDKSLVLIDCGSKKNSNLVKTEIQTVLSAYLGTSNSLKALVLTHPDGDHFSLVNELIVQTNVKIGTLYFGGSASDYGNIAGWIANKGNGNITTVAALGKSYFNPDPLPALSYAGTTYPSVEGRILAANVADMSVKTDANPNSVVVMLTYHDVNIFLMGDATTQTEKFILGWDKINGTMTKLLTGRVAALKAGHHGSNTSSCLDWIQKIQPQVVFISSDTRTFSGVSIPRSTVINNIFANSTVVPIFANADEGKHQYVQYNDNADKHEGVVSTKAMCTTLNYLALQNNSTDFKSYGTSWYYTVSLTKEAREVWITPACGWANVNKTY